MSPVAVVSKRLKFNFAPGREGPHAVDMIVVHVTEGDAGATVSWFQDPSSRVSAHYFVLTTGQVIQFVDENDTAWHAGRVQAPTAPLVLARPGVNPNAYSIGIEHEGDGKHELTDAQRIASTALIADICKRRHIPIDRTHIVGHHEIFSGKTCPGAISVTRLVAGAREVADRPAPRAGDYPRVVWSPYLNDWLHVTQYVSDAEWYYRTASELSLVKGHPAATKLTAMPLHPPETP